MRDRFIVVVHTLVYDDAGRVLLLRRANTGMMDGRLAPPGGHRQAGEPLAVTAARECREEACVEVRDAAPAAVLPFDDGVNVLFEAKTWRGTPRIGEPSRCDGLVFADPGALPEDAVPWLAAALELRAAGGWYRDFTGRRKS